MALSDYTVTIDNGIDTPYVIGQITAGGVRVGVTNATGFVGRTSKARTVDLAGSDGAYIPKTLRAPQILTVEFVIAKSGDPSPCIDELGAIWLIVHSSTATAFSVTYNAGGAAFAYADCQEPSLIEDMSRVNRGLIRGRLSFVSATGMAA